MNKIKCAVISDIHGNYPALKAVLEDSYSKKLTIIYFGVTTQMDYHTLMKL